MEERRRKIAQAATWATVAVFSALLAGCGSAGAGGDDSPSAGGDDQPPGPLYEDYVKILADDAPANADFGTDVVLGPDYMLVGAARDSNGGIENGSVYAFEQDTEGVWRQVQKFTSPETADAESFGAMIQLAGDQVLINGEESGTDSVHVLEQDGNGDWSVVQEFVAQDGTGSFEGFGFHAEVSGNTAVIESSDDNEQANDAGSIYFYDRDADGVWSETQKVVHPDPQEYSYFGSSIAIDGDVAMASATMDQDVYTVTGEVYVFERDGDTWSLVQTITAPERADYDGFGAVAMEGDTALIGMSGDADDTGAVYVYHRSGSGTWEKSAKLVASDGEATDYFGDTIHLENGVATVLATGADDTFGNALYVFEEQSDGSWLEVAKIERPYPADGVNNFAGDVAIGDGVIAVGAQNAPNDASETTGAVYLYAR